MQINHQYPASLFTVIVCAAALLAINFTMLACDEHVRDLPGNAVSYGADIGTGSGSSLQEPVEGDMTTQCQDEVDNDGDRLVDEEDPGCWDVQSNPATYNPSLNREANATTECQDGIDNDIDGLIDALDPDCWEVPGEPATYNPPRNDEAAYDTPWGDCVTADLDGDGEVTITDYNIWIRAWNDGTPIDINGDGGADGDDHRLIVACLGRTVEVDPKSL